MLRSTYRQAPVASASDPLPAGWTEHKAPTGHTYYYNTQTKQSTYTRPLAEPEDEDLQIDYNATAPDQVVQASIKALDEFRQNNPENQRGQGHFTGGKTYQDRTRRNKYQDRPKSKAAIPNCEPWLLVKTKFGRRFVHNTESKESFWKFPQDVMMAVIEMDRLAWEARKKAEEDKGNVENESNKTGLETATSTSQAQPQSQDKDYDSDEYEEVEVTDDEAEGSEATLSKRIRMDDQLVQDDGPPKPVEFDEDDIAWQLAQMEADEAEDDDNYPRDNNYEENQDENEDEEDGLPLTEEDSQSLFRSLLDESHIDPYSTFDAIIESSSSRIIEDPRWVALPNMSSRRTAFTNWSRDRIAEQKAREAADPAMTLQKSRAKDPKVMYLNFLMDNATTKLYWPEFKRKFRKETEMKDLNMSDKDREKLYREYISKLKMAEADRKKEFRDVLKSVPLGEGWNRRTELDVLPDVLVRDLRFYLVRDRKTRDQLVKAHIESLKD